MAKYQLAIDLLEFTNSERRIGQRDLIVHYPQRHYYELFNKYKKSTALRQRFHYLESIRQRDKKKFRDAVNIVRNTMPFGLGGGSTAESLGTPPPRKSKRSKLESVGKPDALMIASPTPSVTASVAVPEIEQKDHYQGKFSHLTLDELKPYCKY